VVKTCKSVTDSVDVGNFPWTTPVTVVTPAIVIVVDPTLTTFAKTEFNNEVSLYEIKLSFLTIFPGNNTFGLLTVLIPEDKDEIVAIPTKNFDYWIVSAVNVDPEPIIP
jgi:hypothetical protein